MSRGFAHKYPEWVKYIMSGVFYLMNADAYNVTFYGKRLHIKKIKKALYLSATSESMRILMLKDKFRELVNKIGLSQKELPCAWNQGSDTDIVKYDNSARAFVCGECRRNCSVCSTRHKFDMFDLYGIYSGSNKFIEQKNFFVRAFVEDGCSISKQPCKPIK